MYSSYREVDPYAEAETAFAEAEAVPEGSGSYNDYYSDDEAEAETAFARAEGIGKYDPEGSYYDYPYPEAEDNLEDSPR